jgi:ornithine carbamoyltransferase
VPAKRDFLSILDVEKDLVAVLELAARIKNRTEAGEAYEPLRGKSLAMIFEKSSTRTRVSFEVGMTQLGGHALFLSPNDLQIGRGETVADTARVLSRFVDGILYRAYKNENVRELARHATVPVINGLDDREHPCQIVGDLLTIREHKGKLEGLKLAYVGDGNNVCHSLMLAAARGGTKMAVATPAGYEPKPEMVRAAREDGRDTGFSLTLTTSAAEAVSGADAVYTDVWASMGQEAEKAERARIFAPYQVNAKLMAKAKKDALFMHCLPAHRGEEVTDEVIDSPNSVVYDEAENRLHAQKAILIALMGKKADHD